MSSYKLNYSGEKIDELLTKIDNLGTGTDTKSGTVKLSSATDSNSGVSDGVAATPSAVSQLKTDMDTKANKTDVLSLEEIQASTDLSGKIASASAVNALNTAIANGTLKIDLLWTNASPTSVFAGQAISLDLSKYKQVEIIFKLAVDVDYIECSSIFDLPSGGLVTPMYQSFGGSSGNFVSFREIAGINANGVNIGNGKKATSFGSYTTNDNLMIPYQIYGVK